MTQLSRKQKYQELRDRLDEETTAAQAQPVKLQRLSRVDSAHMPTNHCIHMILCVFRLL